MEQGAHRHRQVHCQLGLAAGEAEAQHEQAELAQQETASSPLPAAAVHCADLLHVGELHPHPAVQPPHRHAGAVATQ